jgi:hypothetical protein
MTNSLILIVPAVVLLIVAIVLLVFLLSIQRHRKDERRHHAEGEECDRAYGLAGRRDRPAAPERSERPERPERPGRFARSSAHAVLQIRPLSPDRRQCYVHAWSGAESRFVDSPVLALSEADALLTQLLAERGFPVSDVGPDEDRDQATLSPEHAPVLQNYRAGQAIEQANSSARADPEQVRQGLQHFRLVFQALAGPTADDVAEPQPRREHRPAARPIPGQLPR